MRILIVENEKPAADRLGRLLKKEDSGTEIAGITETVEGTVNWLASNPSPDLIFMDILLDDGICFELFETLKVEIPVIFTTAYDEYALRAFRVNSVDYLLKPVDEESLHKALDKYRAYHSGYRTDILRQLSGDFAKQYRNRFLIRIGSHFRSIRVSDIAFFYILERSAFMKTFAGKDYPLDNSLENIQKSVDPEIFFRINRNCLINLEAISDIIGYSSSRLQLKLTDKLEAPDDTCLVVSREKVTSFKNWMDR
jgi:DNA-binding LytR/AlgR family response regulator